MPAKLFVSPPTCRTRPRPSKTPSTSTSSLLLALTGSTEPTNICGERNSRAHDLSLHFCAGRASSQLPLSLHRLRRSQRQCQPEFPLRPLRRSSRDHVSGLETKSASRRRPKVHLAPAPPLAVRHRSQRSLAFPRPAPRARKLS